MPYSRILLALNRSRRCASCALCLPFNNPLSISFTHSTIYTFRQNAFLLSRAFLLSTNLRHSQLHHCMYIHHAHASSRSPIQDYLFWLLFLCIHTHNCTLVMVLIVTPFLSTYTTAFIPVCTPLYTINYGFVLFIIQCILFSRIHVYYPLEAAYILNYV